MNKSSRALAAALVLMSTAGCFGSWNLTRKLWAWNKSVSPNKWVQWFVFLALVIIPVYEVCGGLGDTLIFNSVEFWTGTNPMAMIDAGPRPVIARRTADGMQIRVNEAGKPSRVFDIEVSDQGAVAREGSTVVSRVTTLAGDATLLDGSGNVLMHRSAAQIGEAAQSPKQILTRLLEQDQPLRLAHK